MTVWTARTPPRARPPVAALASVLALLLVALGGVAIRDLAVAQGWASGTVWSRSLVDSLNGLRASTALVAVAGAVAVLGLVVVLTALRPGAKTHLRADAGADLWLSPRAVAALAQFAADRAPGVISAEATRAGRRRIVVEVVTQQDRATVTESVRAAIDARAGALTSASVSVRTKEVPR